MSRIKTGNHLTPAAARKHIASRLLLPVLCAALLFSIPFHAQNTLMTPVPVRTAKKPAVKSELPVLLPVRSGKLWGYADTLRNMKIAPQFDAAYPFIRKYAIVEKNKKAYAIDRNGKIISPAFDQLVQLEDTVLAVYLNQVSDTLGGWGLCTVTGKFILPTAYEQVVPVGNRVYGFRKDSLWGFVDKRGNPLAEMEYDTAWVFNRDFLMLRKKGKLGLISMDGTRILEDKYKDVYRLAQGLFAAKLDTSWGAVDFNGMPIVPFRFDTLSGITSYFVESKERDSSSIYFSRNPTSPTACIYKRVTPVWPYWLKVYNQSGQCGLIDTLGRLIIPAVYQEISPAGCGDWFVVTKEKKWGLNAPGGQQLLAPTFTHITPFRGKVALAAQGREQCLINSDGEILVPLAAQQINIRGNTVKVLHADSSATFLTIGSDGKIAARSDYDQLRTLKVGGRGSRTTSPLPTPMLVAAPVNTVTTMPTPDSLGWFTDGDLWGLRNSYTGEVIFPLQFTEIQRCAGGFTIVAFPDTLRGPMFDEAPTYSIGRYGLVNDSTGRYALTPQYALIQGADLRPNSGFNGCVRVTLKDGQAALVSTDGNEKTTPFTWIDVASAGVIRVCVEGTYSTDGNGEAIGDIDKFAHDNRLDGPLSFGPACLSKEYLKKLVRISGKWGYVDSTGNIIITPQYEAARPAMKGTAIVKLNKKWGLIDFGGATIIPFNYDGLSYMTTSKGTFVMAQMNSLRYGYLDPMGSIVIPADLRQSTPLGDGFIAFSKTGKWGVMKSDGSTIVAETYNEIQPFSDGYAAVRKGKLWGFIDTTGQEMIAPKFDAAGKFSNGLAKVSLKQRWGFVDKNGTLVVDTKYVNAGDYSGVTMPVKTRDGWGLINRQDKWVVKASWVNITRLEGTELYVMRGDFAQGLCRKDGKMLVGPRFDAYRYIGEGRIAYRSYLFWGLADTTGKIITDPIFDKLLPFSNHLAAAEQTSLWGYINKNGRFVIQPEYKVALSFSESRAYVRGYSSGGLQGFIIDTTGKVLFRPAGNGSYAGYEDGKLLVFDVDEHDVNHYFYINLRGNAINRFRYDDARPFDNNAARVKVGNRWGVVSFSGYYLIKPRFYGLEAFDHGVARFQLRYTFGLMTLDGKEILPVEYDDMSIDSSTGMTRYDKANKIGYLFPDGRICWPEME